MLVLNGKKLAETENEFIGSLFESGGTCVGYVKYNKCSVTILNHQKKKVGVINRHGVLCKATKLSEIHKDKRRFRQSIFESVSKGYWYSYGDIDIIGHYESYMQYVNEMQGVLDSLNIKQKLEIEQ